MKRMLRFILCFIGAYFLIQLFWTNYEIREFGYAITTKVDTYIAFILSAFIAYFLD